MNLKAWTAPVIVQDEEPGGNPGSVRTQGGLLPAQLDFAASLTFLPERGWRFSLGFGQWSVEHDFGGSSGSPSLPRAELGIHGLNRWPVKC